MLIFKGILNFFLRIVKQSTEPVVYLYEHWIRPDPETSENADPLGRSKFLLLAMPSILVALSLLAIVTLDGLAASSISNRYIERCEKLSESGDLQTANNSLVRIGNRILSDSARFDSQDRFELARRLAELDDPVQAVRSDRIVEKLAPEDSRGFAPAHRARALATISTLNLRPIDPGSLKALAWHVQQSLGLEDQPLLRLRSDFYLASGQTELASIELSKLALLAPEYWFALAEVQLSRRDLNSARVALNKAAETFGKLVVLNPTDSEARIHYTTALGRMGQFDPAIDSLKAGWNLTNDVRFAGGICDVLLMKLQKHRNLNGPIGQQWDYLQQALEWNPQNRSVYEALSLLCSDPNAQPIRIQLGKTIETLLLKSIFIPEVMFAKSNLLLAQENRVGAMEILTDLVSNHPDFHPALNNTAWLLSNGELITQADLLKAESHARKAVELLPSSGAYRDTFGAVLCKQERWTEAIAEFEISLRFSQTPIPTLECIAVAYDKLGQSDIALQYRTRIDQIRQSNRLPRNN